MEKTEDDLPTFPFPQDDPLSMPPPLRSLQERSPIVQVKTEAGDPAWLVTRYSEVRGLLGDKRLGRSHPDPDNAPRYNLTAFLGGPMGEHETEAADHARFRAALSPHFSPAKMRLFQPRVAGLADELVDAFAAAGPPGDAHAALSAPYASRVISMLLGVPAAEASQFREWTVKIADVTDPESSHQAMADFYAYSKDLTARKRTDPGEDVISALCRTDQHGLDDDHVAFLASALLFAGYETTVDSLDRSLLLLLTHEEAYDALRADPGKIPAAVEEILRRSLGGAAPRYAKTDIDVAQVTVREGDLVLLDPNTADHDPRVFPAPEKFDIDRPHNPHLAFGHGPRYCIGAPLARIELEIMLDRILRRFPRMRLALPPSQLKKHTTTPVSGLSTLPVTW